MRRRAIAHGSFTLIEVLASIAVLSILVIVVAQLLTGTAKIINLNETQMTVEGQARLVFASIGNDLANMLRRTDVDCIFTKQAGNDLMFFYSEMPGSFDSSISSANKSPLSVVGYRINSSYQLERFCKGLTWDDPSGTVGTTVATTGPVFLSFSGSSTNALTGSTFTTKWSSEIVQPPITVTNYRVIGDQVFRLEFCFLRKDGTISDSPALTTSTPLYYQSTTPVYGLSDVSALIVTVALLDANSRKLVSNLSNLVNALPDSSLTIPANQPTLMATSWMNKLTQGAFTSSVGAPVTAVSEIKVYQHYFYINMN